RLDFNFEYGVLHTLAVVLAGTSDAAQAPGTALTRRTDIVTDQYHHDPVFLFPEKWRVSIKIATEMAAQQLRLQRWQQADWCLLVKKAMLQFLALALLICRQYGLAGRIGKQHRAAFRHRKILALQLPAVDQ